MPDVIGTAYVQIEPTTKGISGSLSNILDNEATKAGTSAGGKLSSALGTAAKVGIGAVAGLTTAVIGVGTALTSAASSVAQYGDDIDKMSQKLGVSSSFYQEWDAVLKHSGTSMDAMGATFKKLATASQDASKDQIEAFKAVGLSIDEVKSMTTEELFSSVITGLQEMEEGTERTALATQLLGKGAMEMGALLNTSAEDTQGMIDRVHELGGVMSDDAVKSAAAFQDSLQDMQTAFSGVKNKLMADFLPSITTVMDGLGKLASGDKSGLGQIKEGLKEFLKNLSSMIPEVLKLGGEIIQTLAGAIMDNLGEISDSAIEVMGTLIDKLVDNLPEVIEMGIELIVKLIVGISKAIPKLVEKAPDIIKAIIKGLISAAPELMSAGSDMVEGIWKGIKSAWSDLKDKVKDLAGQLVDSVKGFFKIGSPSKLFRDEVGKWIPEGIAVGIEANSDSVKNAISDVSDEAIVSATGMVKEMDFSYSGSNYDAVDNTENLIEEFASRMEAALLNIGVYMDGRAVGNLIASPVNDALGRMNIRRV